MTPRLPALVLALVSAVVLAACSGGDGAADGGADGSAQDREGPQVIASFYPLEYLVQRLAADHAQISTLTSPGLDPHDVELTPRAVGSLGSADLVVYESGMQPAVDRAVETQAADRSFDVAPVADLLPLEDLDQHEDGEEHEDGAEGEEHDEGGHSADDGHDHGPVDPHFWLDPQRYGDVALALADELAAVDPGNAEAYAANADALVADLQELDRELTEGLARCESRDVITTHEAFGYLGERYDLHVTGITGISPDSEPSPTRLAEVTALVQDLGVTAVYAEPLLSPAIAETVAAETGARVLTLDPADGLGRASTGDDYLEIMRTNLETLREGQGCS